MTSDEVKCWSMMFALALAVGLCGTLMALLGRGLKLLIFLLISAGGLLFYMLMKGYW